MGSEQDLLKLPLIDLSSVKPGSNPWECSCDRVTQALEDYGCFMATYDSVSSELHDAVFESLEELFDLPHETKLRNATDKPYHGYYGQQAHVPVHESLGFEDAQIPSQAQAFTNLMWPQGNTKFSENINTYSKKLSELEQLVKRMIFESYGVNKYLDSSIESTYYLYRLTKYRVPTKDETNLGAFPHRDTSFMTILNQNEVKGLEIKTKDGQWIYLDPFPSSFLVIAGQASMAWSNGRIQSPVHRVMMREEKSRYSIGIFSYDKGIIEVPEELVDDENHPRQFKSFDHFGMLRHYVETKGGEECTVKAYCGV